MKKIDISETELRDYESLLVNFESERFNVILDAIAYLYLYTQEEYFYDEKYQRLFRVYSELRKKAVLKFNESDSLRKMRSLMSVKRKQIDWLEEEMLFAMIEIEKVNNDPQEKEKLISRYVRLFNTEIKDWRISKEDFT